MNALKQYKECSIVFTHPNADTGGNVITDKIKAYVKENDNAMLVDNFGQKGYLSMMACCKVMIGNSSSGIIEATSFKLPVVNIGARQEAELGLKT